MEKSQNAGRIDDGKEAEQIQFGVMCQNIAPLVQHLNGGRLIQIVLCSLKYLFYY